LSYKWKVILSKYLKWISFGFVGFWGFGFWGLDFGFWTLRYFLPRFCILSDISFKASDFPNDEAM
jgi:hypothetical protein